MNQHMFRTRSTISSRSCGRRYGEQSSIPGQTGPKCKTDWCIGEGCSGLTNACRHFRQLKEEFLAIRHQS
ncbi:hypothetical protein C8Q80DRAFT_1139690 [Daedaleopsis nitida]|nr:hypothetical protein C8Q80DRAFT_1139690 [Daedaleopsis nitida]